MLNCVLSSDPTSLQVSTTGINFDISMHKTVVLLGVAHSGVVHNTLSFLVFHYLPLVQSEIEVA